MNFHTLFATILTGKPLCSYSMLFHGVCNSPGCFPNMTAFTTLKWWRLVERISFGPKLLDICSNVSAVLSKVVIPFNSTIDMRTRAFQLKILHRILFTNSALFKMKISTTPLCTFCGLESETLEHLFLDCEYVKSFGGESVA